MRRPRTAPEKIKATGLSTKFRALMRPRALSAAGGAVALGVLGGAFLYKSSLQSHIINQPALPAGGSSISVAAAQAPVISNKIETDGTPNDTRQSNPQNTAASPSPASSSQPQSDAAAPEGSSLQSSSITYKTKQTIDNSTEELCTVVQKAAQTLGGLGTELTQPVCQH